MFDNKNKFKGSLNDPTNIQLPTTLVTLIDIIINETSITNQHDNCSTAATSGHIFDTADNGEKRMV